MRTFLRSLVFFFLFNPWVPAQGQAYPAIFNVRDYGAAGDGTTLDTDAINTAISKASEAGGGQVYFPPGRYLSSSIHLKSHVTLYLESGSVLEAVEDSVKAYDLPEPNEAGANYQDYGHSHWQNSLIWGIGLEDIGIMGSGLIYGKGLNPGFDRFVDESQGKKRYQDGGPGTANKAIALKLCRNVILRDFSILHGGHFGILATGVDNLTIDNLKIDTNRDGIDIDACNNVRVSNCSVNSPWDDGICLKASYGLGKIRHCENITIANCFLTGNLVEGTLLDGTFREADPDYRSFKNGRIKLGTESNGDFKNIAISNCVFDMARGIAIESVDGSHIDGVAISNITMRRGSDTPVFIRLGSRLRGPDSPPVGSVKRISINNLVVSDARGDFPVEISGIPGHPIEDLRLSNLRLNMKGGGDKATGERTPPENENAYPEPGMFGPDPAYGFFIRHVSGLELSHIRLDYNTPEGRPAFVLEDVHDAYLDHLNLARGSGEAVFFDLREVSDFTVEACRQMADTHIKEVVERQKL